MIFAVVITADAEEPVAQDESWIAAAERLERKIQDAIVDLPLQRLRVHVKPR